MIPKYYRFFEETVLGDLFGNSGQIDYMASVPFKSSHKKS